MAWKRFVDRIIRMSLVLLMLGTAGLIAFVRWLLLSPETVLMAAYVTLLVLGGAAALCAVSVLFYSLISWMLSKRRTTAQ